jgi:Holliday junction resolvase RusA-like endonuclease
MLVVQVRGIVPGVKGNSKEARMRVPKGSKTGKAVPMVVGRTEDTAREHALVWLLQANLQRPREPLKGQLLCDVAILRPLPKGATARVIEDARTGRLYAATRPDRGNHLKLFEDALEGAGWIEDDARIVDGVVLKGYSAEPGYVFRLGPAQPGTWWTDQTLGVRPTGRT